MRRVLLQLTIVIATLCPARMIAQNPTVAFPENYRAVMDNADVTVLRVHYGPHETVGMHDHSDHPTVYVYLNDSGPVRFTHAEGFTVIRPPTHTGAYRVSPGRREQHSVENLSEIPSDYLRVELKKVPLGTLKHEFRKSAPDTMVRGTKLEYKTSVLGIERVVCKAGAICALPEAAAPSVLVAFTPSMLLEPEKATAFPIESSTLWLRAGGEASVRGQGQGPAHLLRIVLLDH